MAVEGTAGDQLRPLRRLLAFLHFLVWASPPPERVRCEMGVVRRVGLASKT